MAFTANTCHVICAFPGSANAQERPTSVLGRPQWSRTLAAASTTDKAAPPASPTQGDAVFHVRATADGFGVIAETPDENNVDHPRIALPAGETVTVYVRKGDKLKYVVA